MKYLGAILLLFIYIAASPLTAKAQSMQNENHNLILDPLDEQDIQTTSGPSPTQPKKSPSSPPIKTIQKPPPKNISISISSNQILFGVLSPTSPTIREIDIGLSGTTPEQIVYIKKNGNLENESKHIIPDTSCDQGGCSETIASDWINTLTFGYGYSCDAYTCDEDFIESRYRPFSFNLIGLYQDRIGTGNKRVITIPIKLNVIGTQENGNYTNSITLLSVPRL